MSEIADVKIGELFPVQADSPNCFACGQENPHGIKLRFKKESDTSISTTFTPPKEWTGWGDIMHGGFQALLLDETMSWAVGGIALVKAFVTSNLDIKYLKPVKVQQELKVFAHVEEDSDKIVKVSGQIKSDNDSVLASAKAVFVKVNPAMLVS